MSRKLLSVAEMDRFQIWTKDAVTDGWSYRPTYANEPIGRAVTLERDGYKAMVFTRDPTKEFPAQTYSIDIWGPDGLAIYPTFPYDMKKITAGMRRCGECKKENIETVRVGFAGRVCSLCRIRVAPKIEYPGWTK